MINITESYLLQLIEDFTASNNRMPYKIKGPFNKLYPIGYFASYTSGFMGKQGFMTPLGILELELDTNSVNLYLE